MQAKHHSTLPEDTSCFIRALQRKSVDRTPVWIMRQAGRYLPEYRELRQKAKDFLTLCKTPELASEATLQPLRRYPLDAAIVFSDILTIPDAYGMGLYFVEGEGPQFKKPIQSLKDVQNLPVIDPEVDLGYVLETIKLVKQKLVTQEFAKHNLIQQNLTAIPLIGFSGSPFTLVTYMVEGKASKQFTHIKRWMYQAPDDLQALLHTLTNSVSDYLIAQIRAGADVVMIFDTWGGLLQDPFFVTFSLHWMQICVQRIKSIYPHIPIILFTKNGGHCLSLLANTNCDALGLDWMADLKEAKKMVGNKVALQGNLDPSALYAPKSTIKSLVAEVLSQFGTVDVSQGHIFNLGHGIHPDIHPDHVLTMIEAVHELSPDFHIN